ncbi:hypothetical protein KY327_03680 [Candidatus Woesearchaeota archaeon]|nr:hypothetical protein [Candidatus Woesearchaeota archaeon]
MGITDLDLEDLPPSERVKALRELRAQKRKELEDFRREKEDELKALESRLEDAREDIEEEDAEVREQEVAEDDEEVSSEAPASLEEAVAEAPPQPQGQVSYGIPLPGSLEELSDYNLYSELSRLEGKGYLTSEEQRRVADLRGRASDITDAYSSERHDEVDRQRGNYLSRTEQVLQRLDKKLHDLTDGLYDPSRRDDDAVYQ